MARLAIRGFANKHKYLDSAPLLHGKMKRMTNVETVIAALRIGSAVLCQ